MKQHVEITLRLNLWLDVLMDQDELITHVRTRLPYAFGEELTEMVNPVDILEIRQEAAIYSNEAS
jgi:hypothetical protein